MMNELYNNHVTNIIIQWTIFYYFIIYSSVQVGVDTITQQSHESVIGTQWVSLRALHLVQRFHRLQFFLSGHQTSAAAAAGELSNSDKWHHDKSAQLLCYTLTCISRKG